ncbi:hypothetical protein JHW43_004559 [Diplocarpon mali]|nr:hypothetical protein JHW43_004559 [Diplocarpon mali]
MWMRMRRYGTSARALDEIRTRLLSRPPRHAIHPANRVDLIAEPPSAASQEGLVDLWGCGVVGERCGHVGVVDVMGSGKWEVRNGKWEMGHGKWANTPDMATGIDVDVDMDVGLEVEAGLWASAVLPPDHCPPSPRTSELVQGAAPKAELLTLQVPAVDEGFLPGEGTSIV